MDAETMALRDSLLLVVWMRRRDERWWNVLRANWLYPNVVGFLELACRTKEPVQG